MKKKVEVVGGKEVRALAESFKDIHCTWVIRVPYVIAVVSALGRNEIGYGMCKVSWPDKWDEEKGKELALIRAKLDLARKVLGHPLVSRVVLG